MGPETRFKFTLKMAESRGADWEILLNQAVHVIRSGGVAIFPTETSYMLAADIACEKAVNRLRRIKNRPPDQELSVAIPDYRDSFPYISWTDPARKIAEHFLPGALTIILPIRSDGLKQYAGSKNSLAVRVPALPSLRELLRRINRPVTATSANPHDGQEPYSIDDCVSGVDLIWDAGKLSHRSPTTIIKIDEDITVIRQGAIKLSTILEVLG